MLQDPGKAYQGLWEVDHRAFQQFCVHESGGVSLHMWLGGFNSGLPATRNDLDNSCCPKNMGCEVTEIIICQLI